MGKEILTAEQVLWIVGERRLGRTCRDLARELGVNVSTVIRAAQRMGAAPTQSSRLRGIERPIQHALCEFVKQTIKPLKAPRRRKARRGECAVTWGLHDAHVGMYAWGLETGEDYDVDIAVKRIKTSVDGMVEELAPYKIDRVWMPIGGDVAHYDSCRMQTAFGDHALDVDSRFARVYAAILHALAYMIERALEVTDRVDAFYCAANHDPTAAYLLCLALQQRFLSDPRVTIDIGPCPLKWRLYGGSLVAFHHGHHLQPVHLVTALTSEARDVWSQTTYREIQVGHKHTRYERTYEGVVATNGIVLRRNPALASTDYWHYSHMFLGEPMKSVEACRYDVMGFRGSHVVWIAPQATRPCEYFEEVKRPREKIARSAQSRRSR